MPTLLKGALVYARGELIKADVLVSGEVIACVGDALDIPGVHFVSCQNYCLFPGFIDAHVHLREPGFSYKETIESGTRAAARGGYTEVFSMPNLCPSPDDIFGLCAQLDIIKASAVVGVNPFGTITRGERGAELSDMRALAPFVRGYSDDGRGVQSDEIMFNAMTEAKRLGKIIVAHCEDERFINGGAAHAGEYARAHDLPGISSESEWKMLARDIELVKRTGCAYHACHISTKESVSLIRRAKADGLDITCETAPHYLTLNDSCLRDEGRFKMNPPIRSKADQAALIEGVMDGAIDMIATDHAPHAPDEKNRGLLGSVNGVTGLETAFPVLYTRLVKNGQMPLTKLIELMHDRPKARFGAGGDIAPGARADLTLFDLNKSYAIDPDDFISKGKSSPFAGETVYGECVMTMRGGDIVWRQN